MSRNLVWYCLKKLPLFFLSMLLLSLAVFCAAHFAPGDPLVSYYGERAEKLTPEERAQAEECLGLYDPLHTQYLRWLSNALRGDWGMSYKYKTGVLEVIGKRLNNTLLLGGTGFLLIFLLSPVLGILCARFEDKPLDRLLCRAGSLSSCIPEFWLSLTLILIFSVWLRLLPSSGAYAVGKAGDWGSRLTHLILPLMVVVLSHLWYYAYMIRNQLLEEVRANYVLLAKTKGLSRRQILFRHCLRNILPPYFSMMAVAVPHILGGTYVVETVFSYPGLGALSYESARNQDTHLLMALCLLSGGAVMLCSMLAQAVNERVDPRTRSGGGMEVERRG